MTNLFEDLNPGPNPPEEINVVIDIPRGQSNKYEYNEEEGYFELDRTLFSPMFYPFEYGFVPQTAAGDGDSLDVAVFTTFKTFPGCVIKVRPVGVLMMEDEDGTDNKIVAVPINDVDPRFQSVQDLEDIEEHERKELQLFFKDYKKLEKGKYDQVKVKGWKGKEEAKKLIQKAINDHKKN